jgi:hypothetical protein
VADIHCTGCSESLVGASRWLEMYVHPTSWQTPNSNESTSYIVAPQFFPEACHRCHVHNSVLIFRNAILINSSVIGILLDKFQSAFQKEEGGLSRNKVQVRCHELRHLFICWHFILLLALPFVPRVFSLQCVLYSCPCDSGALCKS